MVFYFTATGNSLYVARQFSDKPFSIPQVIGQENLKFEDDAIGIVSPIFAGEPPKIVLKFLKKASFKTDYLYVIYTYGKSDSDAPEYLHSLLKEIGITVQYIQTIKMVDNYLPAFDMNEEMAMDKQIDNQLAKALASVRKRKLGIPQAPEEGRALHAMVAKRNLENPEFSNGEQITVTDKCISCGICAKVCPAGIFYIGDSTAKRTQNTCEFCLSCAQNCPQKAITLKIADKNPDARYRNEHITLEDIIASNCQIS